MPRRLPHRPLPARTFVFGQSERPPAGWFDDVDDADLFAFGCDCFDAGCYFEAHEVWEKLWLTAKATGDVDDEAELHGLIRLAAAGVKRLAGNESALLSHVEGARRHFARVGRFRRVSADAVSAAAHALLTGAAPALP